MTTIVDLDRSREANEFPPDESFWGKQVDYLISLLDDHRRQIDEKAESKLALAILGGRGSGKSSLLKTLCARIKDKRAKDEFWSNGFYLFPTLDPTIFSSRDQFLYAFLATALDEAERRRERHTLKSQSALQEVTTHLWSIDERLPNPDEDPIPRSLDHLDRHRSGSRLAGEMKKFLDKLSDDLAVKGSCVMILPVDDPDMSFEHLHSVFEQYRRYLQHPLLVPIFAFSEILARDLIAEEYASFFRKSSRSSLRSDFADLSQQYLVKLFPIRHRVLLSLPEEQFLEANFRSRRNKDSEPVKVRMENLLGKLFGDGHGIPISSILPSSLRRQIQLLDAFVQQEENDQPGLSPEIVKTLGEVHAPLLLSFEVDTERLYALSREERARRLLSTILQLEPSRRRIPLSSWKSGGIQREGALLSILAVETFSPIGITEISSRYFLLWLLRLVAGFYLPQLVSLPREGQSSRAEEARSIISPVWHWDQAANETLKLMISRKDHYQPGVLFLHVAGRLALGSEGEGVDPQAFASYISDEDEPLPGELWEGYACRPWLRQRFIHHVEEEIPAFLGFADLLRVASPRLRLLLELWSSYGSDEGSWAAVSLWRGLDLLSQILSVEVKDSASLAEVIKSHLDRRIVSPEEGGAATSGEMTSFSRGPEEKTEYGIAWEAELSMLADELYRWKENLDKNTSAVALSHLHGNMILGSFWRSLEIISVETASEQWGIGTALGRWCRVLHDYGQNVFGVENEKVLGSCPLLQPFLVKLDEATPKGRVTQYDTNISVFLPRNGKEIRLGLIQILNGVIPEDAQAYFGAFLKRIPKAESFSLSELV